MGAQHWWPAKSKIEMMLGAILVQNTNWKNADLALKSLKRETNFDSQQILELPLEDLQQIIKSSGFYKNKGKAIHALLSWLNEHQFNYKEIVAYYGKDLRKELLKIRGVGSETADVLIVYIFGGVEFIPDSYTRRLYAKLGYSNTDSYDKFKKEIQLPSTFTNQDANEFHALLDNFGKNYFNIKNGTHYTFLDSYFE